MSNFLYVAIGGSIGAVFRYSLSSLIFRLFSESVFLKTLVVNLVGSLIIGLLYGIFEATPIPDNLKLFIFVGVLGSFTTFSAFTFESFYMLKDGQYLMTFINISISVLIGISMVFLGFWISRLIT